MKFKIGQEASFSKTITEADVVIFAGICGDFNSVHINSFEAEKSQFGKRICHGALVNSFISTVLGMYMPGPGTIYLSQESKFLNPVYIGDTITAKCIITSLNESGKAELSTNVINQNDDVVISGKALVLLPREK